MILKDKWVVNCLHETEGDEPIATIIVIVIADVIISINCK